MFSIMTVKIYLLLLFIIVIRKGADDPNIFFSVTVDIVKDGAVIPAKVVYVQNRNKRKEYLCLISTDATLSEEEIIRIYRKRWDIAVFFKFCKSYLNLSEKCRSMSYDEMTAYTAVVLYDI